MGKKGENKTMKSLAAPTARTLERKRSIWTVRGQAGPHSKATSVPLCLILRDLVQCVDKIKEAKLVLHQRKIKVNGLVRKDKSFPVGLFDVVDLEARKERFRIVFDSKGRLKLVTVNPADKLTKISKVVGKNAIKGGLIQLTLNDGRVLQEKKTDLNPGDSVRISLPDSKLLEKVKLEKGNLVYLIAGRHVGGQAVIKEVSSGTMSRERLITLVEGDRQFQTTEKNLIVVGTDKPLVELAEK
jgi:small subunit ribosomal protein S4e